MFSFNILFTVYAHFISKFSGMASTKHTLMRRTEVGSRVELNLGDFIPYADPKKKRSKESSFATVVEAAGAKRWVILRDINGRLREVSSR